jgi:hypothetical protein
LESFVPDDKANVVFIAPRIDYWLTANAWTGLPDEYTGSFYATWTGFLVIKTKGDYRFSIGTTDVAYLEWHHAESDTWATYKQLSQGSFIYSSTVDQTPETVRELSSGYHRIRIRFWRREYEVQPYGLVLKYNGPDVDNVWKVIPSEAFVRERPGCLTPDFPKQVCEEGYVIAAGGTCTLNNTVACPPSQITQPASVSCDPPLGRYTCILDPAVEKEMKAKAEAEMKVKAEAEKKAKAEAELKAKAEAEQKSKGSAEAEKKEKAELEQKAKANAEALQKANSQPPEAPTGTSISRWR